jgi:hypothetical protein
VNYGKIAMLPEVERGLLAIGEEKCLVTPAIN